MTKFFQKEKVVVGILQEIGYTDVIGGVTLTVVEKDGEGNLTKGRGITVPSGVAGFALECEFVDTDKTAGTHKLYRNIGTTSSCTFDLVGEISAADITDESILLADIADNQLLGKLTVRNDTGGTLTAGTLVRVTGYDSTNGLTVDKADADANAPATHFVAASILNAASGDVYELGVLTGYNTNGRTIGDPVYLDATTAGGLSFSAPTGADQVSQQVGVVKVVHASTGEVYLFPGLLGLLKIGTSFMQDQSINANKLDSGMFVTYGGLAKDGSNLRTGMSVYNNTGGALTPGTLLNLSGYDGANGVTVTKADADAGVRATHVVIMNINNAASGLVVPFGVAQNLNTDAAAAVGDPVYVDATTPGAFTFAAPTGINQMVQVVGVVRIKNATTGEIVFFPGSQHITKIPNSWLQNNSITAQQIASGAVTPGHLAAPENLTATADGLTTGQMSGDTGGANVTSASATDWITLPDGTEAAFLMKQYIITVGANGFELVTPSGSNATINGADADGTNQADIPANSTSRLTLVASNTWLLENIGSNGTVAAAIVPDND